MTYARGINLISSLLLAIALSSTFSVSANADWLNERKFKAQAKKMKRAGKYPASIDCRAQPGRKTFKPQIKAVWRDNTSKKDWVMYNYKGLLDFTPNQPGKPPQYRRTVKKVLKAGRGGST